MLVNPNIQSNPEGFNPNVDNTVQYPQVSKMQKMGWYAMLFLGCLVIVGGIVLIVKSTQYKNYFQKKQIEINNASSTIDVYLAKRRDTLIKLLEQAKSYMKFEKETLEDITTLRTIGSKDVSQNQAQKILDNVDKHINFAFESYPNLKSSSIVMELMSSSQYLEQELASARRLYNQNVSDFNSKIFLFPQIVMSSKMKLSTFPFYVASATQKEDVDMGSLNNSWK